MKKISFILVVLLLLFCGCGSNNYSNSSSNSTATTKNTTTSASTTQTTISTTTTTSAPEYFSIKLSFAGDCMLASYKGEYTNYSFNQLAKDNPPEYFLQNVSSIFSEDDFSLVNLENVFTDSSLEEVYKNYSPAYWFKSPKKNAEILKAGGIEAVSIDNNHIGDYGTQGQEDTIDALNTYEIEYGIDDKIIYYQKNGFTVSFICEGLWYEGQSSSIISKIKIAEENSDYQVVFFHGGTEKIHQPEQWKVNACHKIVNAGADLVIGGHPHVLQPREVYNGVEIVYSLGNFCYGGHTKPENATIIYQVELLINEEDMSIKEYNSNIIPCYVFTGNRNNYQPEIIDTNSQDYQNIIDFMNNKINSPV